MLLACAALAILMIAVEPIEAAKTAGLPLSQEIDNPRLAQPPEPAAKCSVRVVLERLHPVSQLDPHALADFLDRIIVKPVAATPLAHEGIVLSAESSPRRIVAPV